MLSKQKQQTSFDILKETFGYKNRFQAPRLVKVVISSGVGKADGARKKMVEERLARITGQKPSARVAKASIAQFKVREGDHIGFQVTLRGSRMFDFADKLIHIALPRTRDFRGIPKTALDDIGNLTLGIREHTIFPETGDEDLKDVFGLAITFVTTAKTKKEAEAFFTHLGIPFRS